MSYFDKIVGKLFSGKKPVGTAAVHEVLKRSERDQQRYIQWKESEERQDLLREIAKAYYYKKTNIQSPIEVHLFNTVYANGFAVTYPGKLTPKIFQYLFEYFKDTILAMQYRLVTADRRILDRELYVETIEKYYLKPPMHTQQITAASIDQQYGNVVLEYILINDKPSYMKLLVNVYSDSLYKDALDYDEFMSRLLKAE